MCYDSSDGLGTICSDSICACQLSSMWGSSILHRLVAVSSLSVLMASGPGFQVPFPSSPIQQSKMHCLGCKASKALVHPLVTDRGRGRLKIPGQLSSEIVLIDRSHGQEWLDMIPRFLRQQCALHFQVLRQNIETDRGGGVQSSP